MEEGILGARTGAGGWKLGSPPVQPVPPQLNTAIAGSLCGRLEELKPDLLGGVSLDYIEYARGDPLNVFDGRQRNETVERVAVVFGRERRS